MTSDELEYWARYTAMEDECAGKLVVLAKDDGLLLQTDGTWSESMEGARRFHFNRDSVRAQIEEVEARFGKKWNAISVEEKEV